MKSSCLTFMLAAGGMATAAAALAAGDPIAIAVNTEPTPAETAAIKQALGPEDYGDMQPLTVGHADLNGDRRPDLLARSDGMGGCGSAGCQTWAVLATPSGYAPTAITLAVAAGKPEAYDSDSSTTPPISTAQPTSRQRPTASFSTTMPIRVPTIIDISRMGATMLSGAPMLIALSTRI